MFRIRVAIGTILLLLGVCALSAAYAQQAQLDDQQAKLTNLYETLLHNPTDPSVARKIASQRAIVRAAIDDEMNNFINTSLQIADGEKQTSSTSYDHQRTLVTALQARADEVKVDLDLLNDEEKKYYLSQQTGTGSADAYRITGSHAELLARKAVLEERQTAVQFFLGLQQDRLHKLSVQQQLEQFSIFISIGKYLVFILVWVLLERFFRGILFSRIKNRNRRYRLMKFFTGGMYAIMILWLFARLFAEYPGIVTSFAIIGAGVAVALQDVIKDIIGWMIIVQKRIYTLGDRVSIGDVTGDVLDISLLRTTLIEVRMAQDDDVARSGQPIHIPNAHVLTRQVLNFSTTSDFHEAEIQVTIPHRENWKKAEKILKDILDEETKEFTEKARRQNASRTIHFFLPHEAKDARIFMELSLKGIVFALRFPVPIGERRFVVSRLSGRIVDAFAKAKIELLSDKD